MSRLGGLPNGTYLRHSEQCSHAIQSSSGPHRPHQWMDSSLLSLLPLTAADSDREEDGELFPPILAATIIDASNDDHRRSIQQHRTRRAGGPQPSTRIPTQPSRRHTRDSPIPKLLRPRLPRCDGTGRRSVSGNPGRLVFRAMILKATPSLRYRPGGKPPLGYCKRLRSLCHCPRDSAHFWTLK